MKWDMEDALEAIVNLLYLVRASLDNKETADTYLAIAEEVILAAAKRSERATPGCDRRQSTGGNRPS